MSAMAFVGARVAIASPWCFVRTRRNAGKSSWRLLGQFLKSESWASVCQLATVVFVGVSESGRIISHWEKRSSRCMFPWGNLPVVVGSNLSVGFLGVTARAFICAHYCACTLCVRQDLVHCGHMHPAC